MLSLPFTPRRGYRRTIAHSREHPSAQDHEENSRESRFHRPARLHRRSDKESCIYTRIDSQGMLFRGMSAWCLRSLAGD